MSAVAVVKTMNWTNPTSKKVVPAYKEVRVWCPGCESYHHFTVQILDPEYRRGNGSEEPVWTWDGNLEKPTFNPSMLAYSSVHICKEEHPPEPCTDYENCEINGHLIMNKDWRSVGAKEYAHTTPHTKEPARGNCHSFLHDGVWEFLNDSAHKLAGKHVPMVPIPDEEWT